MNAVFNLCPHTTCAFTETMNICNVFIESLQTCESQKYGMSSSANFYYKIQAGRETDPLSASPTMLFILKLKLRGA